ncbi:MAG: hypothetical protein ACOX1P_11935 [Thermoguttaceae bacterium]|jgi:hypothetical protein
MRANNATSRTPSVGATASYVLKWYEGSPPRYGWFIRGIHPDRSFFGEISVFIAEGGKQANVAGKLSETDYARFLHLVRGIEERASEDESDAPWDGLLAVGPTDSPRILFKYRTSDTTITEAGLMFLQVVDIMAPYLRGLHESLE